MKKLAALIALLMTCTAMAADPAPKPAPSPKPKTHIRIKGNPKAALIGCDPYTGSCTA